MVETGLIVAEVVFLLLLYLFVWSVVRSSSRELGRVQPPPSQSVPASPVAPPSAAEAEHLRRLAAAAAPARRGSATLEEAPEPPTATPSAPERATNPGLGPEPVPVEFDPTPPPDPQPTVGYSLAALEAEEAAEAEAAAQAEAEAEAESETTGPVVVPQPTAESPVEPDLEPEPTARVGGDEDQEEPSGSLRDSGPIFDLSGLSPRLVVESSPALPRAREFPLEGGMTIGRSGAAEMSIRDQYVSHMHARILRRGAYYFVADLGSTNGTFLNDRRIERDAQLKVHDTLRIGQTILRYEE